MSNQITFERLNKNCHLALYPNGEDKRILVLDRMGDIVGAIFVPLCINPNVDISNKRKSSGKPKNMCESEMVEEFRRQFKPKQELCNTWPSFLVNPCTNCGLEADYAFETITNSGQKCKVVVEYNDSTGHTYKAPNLPQDGEQMKTTESCVRDVVKCGLSMIAGAIYVVIFKKQGITQTVQELSKYFKGQSICVDLTDPTNSLPYSQFAFKAITERYVLITCVELHFFNHPAHLKLIQSRAQQYMRKQSCTTTMAKDKHPKNPNMSHESNSSFDDDNSLSRMSSSYLNVNTSSPKTTTTKSLLSNETTKTDIFSPLPYFPLSKVSQKSVYNGEEETTQELAKKIAESMISCMKREYGSQYKQLAFAKQRELNNKIISQLTPVLALLDSLNM